MKTLEKRVLTFASSDPMWTMNHICRIFLWSYISCFVLYHDWKSASCADLYKPLKDGPPLRICFLKACGAHSLHL